jgi:hypothetical protein
LIRRNLGSINNNNNNNNTIINNCNRFDESDNNNPPGNNQENKTLRKYQNSFEIYSLKLIQFWSSFSQTSKHNYKKPYNKTCSQIIKDLTGLQKGTFSNNKQFDLNWIKQKNIPENWFTKAWTYQELKDGISQASKYALEGYWPNKNKIFFKSLANVIYNPRKCNSWLFTAMKHPPQLLEKSQFKNPLPKTTEKVIKMKIWPKNYEFDIPKLARGLVELKTFSDNLVYDKYNKINQHYGSLNKLLKEYFQWIEEQNWIEINENIIGTKNKVFKRFIEAQEKEIGGIKIKSNFKERR